MHPLSIHCLCFYSEPSQADVAVVTVSTEWVGMPSVEVPVLSTIRLCLLFCFSPSLLFSSPFHFRVSVWFCFWHSSYIYFIYNPELCFDHDPHFRSGKGVSTLSVREYVGTGTGYPQRDSQDRQQDALSYSITFLHSA